MKTQDEITDEMIDYIMLEGVKEELQLLFYSARKRWYGENLTFKITSGIRTNAQQEKLYMAGRSQVKRDGAHVQGRAVDICMILNGKVNWERIYYIQFYGFIKELFTALQEAEQIDFKYRLTWGGDWNRNEKILEEKNWEVDCTHYQLDWD